MVYGGPPQYPGPVPYGPVPPVGPPYPYPVFVQPPPPRYRPVGITIIAALMVVVAIISILGSIVYFTLGAICGSVPVSAGGNSTIRPLFWTLSAALGILGVMFLIEAWGLFLMKPWAWNFGMVVLVVGLILELFSITISTLSEAAILVVFDVIALIYLAQPNVRAAFLQRPPGY